MSRQRPDDLGPGGLGQADAGLNRLLAALAAGPVPGELAGEPATMAMFRANYRQPGPPGSQAGEPLPDGSRLAGPPLPAGPPLSAGVPAAAASPLTSGSPASAGRPPLVDSLLGIGRPPSAPGARRGRRSGARAARLRTGFVAATALALAGTVSAAYAAALPPPVQHVAYQVLGFAGVPDSSRSAPSRPRPAGQPGHGRTTGGGPASSPSVPPRPTPPASPSPRPASSTPAVAVPHEQLAIAAQRSQIAAGATAVLTGQLSRGGHRLPGVTLSLQERPAGQTRWQPAGTATTSAVGRVAVDVSGLASNADFRFAGPRGRTSGTVTVTVVPAVSLRQIARRGGFRDAFAARSAFAQAGDVVVLQIQSGGGWVDVRVRRLGVHQRAVFVIAARRAAGRTLRVVLLATGTHAASASSPLPVPSG